ncbi:MAG TPA: ADP-ribosylglycohydrolase family protein [Gemmatimonadaceae bacterium]|nr:ADP-ribosylglycohydrolase family protein [Gemmatimonadaceae bacterium]
MREQQRAPHANSYWVPLPDGMIVAGEYPGDLKAARATEKIRAILDAGITCFVDLTEHDELAPYEPLLRAEADSRGVTVRHLRRPIRDMRVASLPEMRAILQTIRDAIEAGERVYVHCWGGIGRTGTVVGCWLVEQGMSADEALARVTALFRTMSRGKVARHPEGSPQTDAQRAMVRDWPVRAAPARPAPRSRAARGGARDREHYRGCLLGGAVGDALGAPVEFMPLGEIRRRFGADGIAELSPAYGKLGAITDDTQMTLFTAEGALRAMCRGRERGICWPPGVFHHAYLRWLRTQGARVDEIPCDDTPGWLAGVRELHARRAPGNSCLSALESGSVGSMDEPINNSKGCGGVMRAAPAGLIGDYDPFLLGCEAAAVTHGHPSGYLAAGALAMMIERIVNGAALPDAVGAARERLSKERGHEEVSAALERAVSLASHGPPSAAHVESLGGGWIAEEALAIAVYCALVAGDDFERGVRLAVNHGGDSDSTGAIAGNLLGAALGVSAIPPRWLEVLELRDVIERLADDLVTGYEQSEEWWAKYPGC